MKMSSILSNYKKNCKTGDDFFVYFLNLEPISNVVSIINIFKHTFFLPSRVRQLLTSFSFVFAQPRKVWGGERKAVVGREQRENTSSVPLKIWFKRYTLPQIKVLRSQGVSACCNGARIERIGVSHHN